MFSKIKQFIMCLLIACLAVTMPLNSNVVYAVEDISISNEADGDTEESKETEEKDEDKADADTEDDKKTEEKDEGKVDADTEDDKKTEEKDEGKADADTEDDKKTEEKDEDKADVDTEEGSETEENDEEKTDTIEDEESIGDADEEVAIIDDEEDLDDIDESDIKNIENQEDILDSEDIDKIDILLTEGVEVAANIELHSDANVVNGIYKLEFSITLTDEYFNSEIFLPGHANMRDIIKLTSVNTTLDGMSIPRCEVLNEGKTLHVIFDNIYFNELKANPVVIVNVSGSSILYDNEVSEQPEDFQCSIPFKVSDTVLIRPMSGTAGGEWSSTGIGVIVSNSPGKNLKSIEELTSDMFELTYVGSKANLVNIESPTVRIAMSGSEYIISNDVKIFSVITENDDFRAKLVIKKEAFKEEVADDLTLVSDPLTTHTPYSHDMNWLNSVRIVSGDEITVGNNLTANINVTASLPEGVLYNGSGFIRSSQYNWSENINAYCTFNDASIAYDRKSITFGLNVHSFDDLGTGVYKFVIPGNHFESESESTLPDFMIEFPLTVSNNGSSGGNTGGGSNGGNTDAGTSGEDIDNSTVNDNANSTSSDNTNTSNLAQDTTETKEPLPIITDSTLSQAKITQNEETGVYEIVFNQAVTTELLDELSSSPNPTNLNINLFSSNTTVQKEQPQFDIALSIKALKESDKLTTITLNTRVAKVDLPMKSLEKVNSNENVKIRIEEPQKLQSLMARAISGGRPAVSFDVTVGGKPVDLMSNPANLSLKYKVTPKDEALKLNIGVIFLGADGRMSKIESTYNEDTGLFEFSAAKAGTYFIGNIGNLK